MASPTNEQGLRVLWGNALMHPLQPCAARTRCDINLAHSEAGFLLIIETVTLVKDDTSSYVGTLSASALGAEIGISGLVLFFCVSLRA